MLRHQSTLTLGLAALFVLPASLPGSQEPVDLEERLEATLAALAHLGGIERRVHSGADVWLDLIGVTEAPSADAMQRDETLVLLRSEVAGLHQRWDELSTGSPFTPGMGPLPAPTDGGSATPATHVGLESSTYRDLDAQTQPRIGVTNPDAARNGQDLRSFEEDAAFSADSQRQGRLLARSARWSEALQLLLPHAEDAEARYWISRCYEGLQRYGEAIDLLEDLVAAGQPDEANGVDPSPDARSLARRATYDLRFLQLRRELESKKTTPAETSGE